MRALTAALAAVVAVLAAAPPAAAKPKSVSYLGKTKGGPKVTFSVSRGNLWKIRTKVAVTCVASNQGVVTDPALEAFDPDWGFPLGYRIKARDKVGYPLYSYEVVSRRKGKTIKGTLAMTYSELTNGPDGRIRAQRCSGRTTFSARPRERR